MELHERIMQANALAVKLKETRERTFVAWVQNSTSVGLSAKSYGSLDRAQKVVDEINVILEKYNAEYLNELEAEVAKAFAGVEE